MSKVLRMTAELVWDAKALLGEGPVWDECQKALLWVDIKMKRIHRYEPGAGIQSTYQLERRVGSFAAREKGGYVLAAEDGFFLYDPDGAGEIKFLADPEAALSENRFNDGKCDPSGRFWAGTMEENAKDGAGSLYRLDTDRTVSRMVEGVSCSNGLAWNVDASILYYIDSMTHRVDAFDYDNETGDISNRRPVIRFSGSQEVPDGLTIDSEGCLWVALWGSGQVTRWDPATGEKLAEITVPATFVSSCTFGGEAYDELYITTARLGLTPMELQSQPLAGGLFRVRPGVKGTVAAIYKG